MKKLLQLIAGPLLLAALAPVSGFVNHPTAASKFTFVKRGLQEIPSVALGMADDPGRSSIEGDKRFYTLRLPLYTGIEWGTDLSFRYVFAQELEPDGPAFGFVEEGDYLCQFTPISEEGVAGAPIPLAGAAFDFVIDTIAELNRNKVEEVDVTFFRGSIDELRELGDDIQPSEVTLTVIENKGAPDEKTHIFKVPAGSNIRQVCVDNGINVYQSFSRWTNCKGKQFCGTCIVNAPVGIEKSNIKSIDETSCIQQSPLRVQSDFDTNRLSCVTFAYGDMTIETQPPVDKKKKMT